MSRERVVVVGSLNCDFVMRVPRRPGKGETVIGTSFDTFVGGKGNNQAIAAARAGAAVSMIGRVGADHFGGMIEDKLAAAGVDRSFLIRDREISTGVAGIVIDAEGDNSIVVAPQANGRLSPADLEAAAPAFADAAVVLVQLEIDLATVAAAVKMGRAAGATVVLNPAPAPPAGLPAEILASVDLVVPNQSEARILTGIAAEDFPGAALAARALQGAGAREVIVTMGELGALWLDGSGGVATTPAFPVEVLDTTAAGDAFCGALVAAIALGKSRPEVIRWASAAGALACTKLGAEPSLPHREEIARRIAAG